MKSWRQTDNSNSASKIAIRNTLMKRLGAPPRVLDAFCGNGHLYEACYKKAEYYHGLDKVKVHSIGTCELVRDNKAWVKHGNLSDFNFFDLDAHTSPWEIFWLCISNPTFGKTHKRIAFALTDGARMNLKLGSATIFQHAVLKIPRKDFIPCLHRHYPFFLRLILTLAARQSKGKLEDPYYQALNRSTNVAYMGFILCL